jgi:hypothetical protein
MILDSLNEDFQDVLLTLADEKVEFLVVGAYALAFHGAPRSSGDIDLYVRPSGENARRTYRALQRFGAPLISAGVSEQDLATPGIVYQIGMPPRRIDVLTEISGVTFDEAWASRVAAELDGRTVYFIGRAELLRNKHSTGRPKDLADASRLERREPTK